MAIDPETIREMFAASEPQSADEIDEPPIRGNLIEPPIRKKVLPPSKEEIEAAAADELLKIAAEEEQELKDVRKAMRSKDTFVMRCPNGCRIRVKEQHRGRTGKCPHCQSEFVVPKKGPAEKDEKDDVGNP